MEVTVLDPEEAQAMDDVSVAEDSFIAGAVNMINGSLQMVMSLVHLKENRLYQNSPLVAHHDTPPGWKVYLKELVAHAKERNPELQISMSGLQNGLWRHKVLVEHFGIDEREALGLSESLVREIRSMAHYDYLTGKPLGLKDGYRVDLLPIPPDTPESEKLNEGLRTVIKDAVAQPVISRKMFDDYKSGTGSTVTNVSFAVNIDAETALVSTFTAFIQQFDGEGKATQDYAVNLLGQAWPCEVVDKLIDGGWNVEWE